MMMHMDQGQVLEGSSPSHKATEWGGLRGRLTPVPQERLWELITTGQTGRPFPP